MVMAHELGHAILHVKDNCYFLNSNTFLLTSKLEKQANIFAAELLLTDNFLNDCDGLNIEQISCLTGVNINLVKLKMERF
jgi:Zn-dependent peptidase ImmA (M78 family)